VLQLTEDLWRIVIRGKEEKVMLPLQVKDIMTRKVITVRPDTSIAAVAALLQQHHIGGVPVIDAAEHLLGIVTETDLFLKEKGVPFSSVKVPSLLGQFIDKETLARLEERAKQVVVQEVMTTNVVTVEEEASIADLAMLMYEKDLTRIPVVKEGKLRGIVSRVDVLRAIYSVSRKKD
jgi:CBS domain-containing protein